MAYSRPPTWSHGGQDASAARFNIISDDLTALYAAMTGDHVAVGATGGQPVSFVNTYRWLHYMSTVSATATITGSGADVTLPDSTTSMAVYDMSGVTWLTPGMAYTLSGVQYAAEDSTA